MARRFGANPFLSKYAERERFQEELNCLPQKIRKVIIPFLTEKTTEDQFHDMILCCYEVAAGRRRYNFAEEAKQQILERHKERQKEDNLINNPFRNISLNQCFGDSKTPVSEWLMPPGQSEWDDLFDFEE